jgi:hypothetical protein
VKCILRHPRLPTDRSRGRLVPPQIDDFEYNLSVAADVSF